MLPEYDRPLSASEVGDWLAEVDLREIAEDELPYLMYSIGEFFSNNHKRFWA